MVHKDAVSSTVVFLLSLGAFILAGQYAGGAELFPRGLAVIMMVTSALVFIRAVAWPQVVPDGIPKMELPDLKRTAICVLITIAYIALIVPLGFAIASIMFIVVIAYAMGYRRHRSLWLTAILFVGILYYLFVHVFHTPFPEGVILGALHH